MRNHAPDEHALIRDTLQPRHDRRLRPEQTYQCSCGRRLRGMSRRQAAPAHRAHRKEVRDA
jgi:hypothetical protein